MVSCKQIVFPEVSRQPNASHGPHGPLRPTGTTTHWIGQTPNVRVVVSRPPAAAVKSLSYPSPRYCQFVDEIEERAVALREAACLSGPVIHLGVDIQRPV